MSNYCTNCKWLGKKTLSNHTTWLCKRKSSIGYMLQSLCGDPTKRLQCINENWYEVKVKQQEKKMTTEEMIKVMQAYMDGKTIQFKEPSHDWCDANKASDILSWDWARNEYRIKQEHKYRPLKPEELIELKGKWLINKKDKCLYATAYLKPNIVGIIANGEHDPEQLLKYWTYEDGTPCGRLEEQ